MQTMSPADFGNHEEWLAFVRHEIPSHEQAHALARGRTELFRRFYELRGQAFPAEFLQDLARIEELCDPERVRELETLNDRIMARLIETLFGEAQPGLTENEDQTPLSPREQVLELLDHLMSRNPYFRFWTDYKVSAGSNADAESWDDYLRQELGDEGDDAIAFAKSMAELDRLLAYFRDREIPLPRYFFERAWFLHYLRGPERSLQTRALLNTLMAEIAGCMSA